MIVDEKNNDISLGDDSILWKPDVIDFNGSNEKEMMIQDDRGEWRAPNVFGGAFPSNNQLLILLAVGIALYFGFKKS